MQELLGLLATVAFGIIVVYLPAGWCIWRYVLEPRWKDARGYFWGLCGWSAMMGLWGLTAQSGKFVVLVLLAWVIWVWADLIKTRA